MTENIFVLFILILGVFAVFGVCNTACEYRNYSTGHRFIKAFRVQTSFQSAFTLLQSQKDINQWDMKKITYVGYYAAIFCTITGILIIPFTVVMYFINKDIAIWTYLYWCGGCLAIGMFAF